MRAQQPLSVADQEVFADGIHAVVDAPASCMLSLKRQKKFQIYRSGDGFILRQASSVLIFDNASGPKRYPRE